MSIKTYTNRSREPQPPKEPSYFRCPKCTALWVTDYNQCGVWVHDDLKSGCYHCSDVTDLANVHIVNLAMDG